MRFEELVYFAAFVEVEPENIETEERIYTQIKDILGYSRDSYQIARDKYNSHSKTLSQMDMLEIKRAGRDFDARRKEIKEDYEKSKIDFSEKIRRILNCSNDFERRLNEILGEPLYDETKVAEFSFSDLYNELLISRLYK